jgi:hypothetical protein
MALIYRAIFEVDDADFVMRAGELASDWARWKLERPELVLAIGEQIDDPERGIELRCLGGNQGDAHVFRTVLYENRARDGEEVRSTFTALSADGRSWGWMDVERWTQHSASRGWIPFAPSLVRTVLGEAVCRRGPTRLERDIRVIGRDDAPLLVSAILEPTREIPLIIVTRNQRLEDGLDGAETRARELNRHLLGIACTFVLGEGAASAFSKAMLDAVGPDMDVHSGAVRVYLPGVGLALDYPRRHRFLPWRKLEGRRPETAGRILSPPLLRRAAEMPPPQVWRSQIRAVIDGGESARELEELFATASDELETVLAERRELEERLAEYELLNAELLRRGDDLARRVSYLQTKLAPFDTAAAFAEPEQRSFVPEFCSDALVEARRRLDLLEIPDAVDEGALELDEHANESWAQKAWTAFQALQAYAEAKRDRNFQGDFKTFCERGGEVVLPTRWVARHESETTRNNQRFRELRTLPVNPDIEPSGRVFMDSHIRIELGGSPSPRIHFHDDTGGATGKIHIGWFGDHLDSASKS